MTLGAWEIALIILLVILLFGAKRLPDAARSLGRSMRIFKSEVKEMGRDEERENDYQQSQQSQQEPGQLPPHQSLAPQQPQQPQQVQQAQPSSQDPQRPQH